jgi:hypothetical protein
MTLAIEMMVIGFVAGLFTMIVIDLYKNVLKIMNR